jgi:hypothetical protein
VGGSGLLFSNTNNGNFNRSDACVKGIFDGGGAGGSIEDDLWNNSDDLPSVNSLVNNATPSGQYRFSGSTTWSTNASYNKNLVVLVSGDLTIAQNVNAANNRDHTIVFIVSGNINIQRNVSEIDAVLIANGTVNTCSNGVLSVNGGSSCDGKLTINGSVIADNIAFRRTYKGVGAAAAGCLNISCAAEVINFDPALYLNGIDLNYGDVDNPYDIDQLRDLPPVF